MFKRIRIIGAPGSGKTWLASHLAEILHVKVYDLDDVYFAHKYSAKRDKEECKQMVEAMCKQETWVIEGVYPGSWCKDSFEQADVIINITAHPAIIIKRLLKREFKKRTSLKGTWGLIRYSLGYDKTHAEVQAVIKQYEAKTINVDSVKLSKDNIANLLNSL